MTSWLRELMPCGMRSPPSRAPRASGTASVTLAGVAWAGSPSEESATRCGVAVSWVFASGCDISQNPPTTSAAAVTPAPTMR